MEESEHEEHQESIDQDEFERNEEIRLIQEAMNVDGLIETQRSVEDGIDQYGGLLWKSDRKKLD